jgi:tRNA pseudouridine13 synthase
VSAIQSAAYNRLLDDRLSNGTFESLREGDVAFRHEGGSSFLVSRVDLERGDLEERLARGELSPAGPLWGAKLLEASGETAARELEALAAFGVEPSMLASGPDAADGARRPYRMFPKNIELDAGTDEHGAYVRLAFDLSKGGFATTLLRELIDEQSAEPRPSGRPRDGDE